MQVSWRTNVQVYKFHLFFNYNLQKPRDLMRNTTFCDICTIIDVVMWLYYAGKINLTDLQKEL